MELDKEASLDNVKELFDSLSAIMGDLIVPIVSVGISVLLVFLVIVPGIRDIQEAREEKVEKEVVLRELEEKRALLSRYASQSQRVDSALEVVRHAIPLEDEVPEVMTQLQDMADISRVVVSNLTYRSGSKEEEDLKTVEMNFGFDGDFSNVKGLFELMENASRIVVADQFNLKVQEEASMSASLSLKSFFMPAPTKAKVEEPLEDIFSSNNFNEALDSVRDLDVYEVEVQEGQVGKENPFVE